MKEAPPSFLSFSQPLLTPGPVIPHPFIFHPPCSMPASWSLRTPVLASLRMWGGAVALECAGAGTRRRRAKPPHPSSQEINFWSPSLLLAFLFIFFPSSACLLSFLNSHLLSLCTLFFSFPFFLCHPTFFPSLFFHPAPPPPHLTAALLGGPCLSVSCSPPLLFT